MLTVASESGGEDARTGGTEDARAGGVELGESVSLIDQIVREGAQRMLAEALHAEVENCVAGFADERDEHACRIDSRTRV